MGRHFFAFVCALLALVCGAGCAAADQFVRPEAGIDLGAAATSGDEALQGIADRETRVVNRLACEDELGFWKSTRGKPGDRDTKFVIGKAAFLSRGGRTAVCDAVVALDLHDWERFFDPSDVRPGPPGYADHHVASGGDSWRSLEDSVAALLALKGGGDPDPTIQAQLDRVRSDIKSQLNQRFDTEFGPACHEVVADIGPDAGWPDQVTMHLQLTSACLDAEIGAFIMAHDFGRNGANPGTTGLPCRVVLVATAGEWDQANLSLVRLAYLLLRARSAGALYGLSTDPRYAAGEDALKKLQNELLTIAKGPADETYSLVGCGNYDNSYGDARDRIDEKDFYDDSMAKTVDGNGGGGGLLSDALFALLFLLLAALTLGAALAVAALLAGAVALGAAGLAAAVLAAIFIVAPLVNAVTGGVEETENHLLMQNSEKLLTNKLLIDRAYDDGDYEAAHIFENYNTQLRQWFFDRYRTIVAEDFKEYNAKPYARLSMFSSLNLYDFACEAGYFPKRMDCDDKDSHLTTAALGVLDLTAAKAAVSSNEGRRFVPYRRLAHMNTVYMRGQLRKTGKRDPPRSLLAFVGGADHLLAALQFWTGQTSHVDQDTGPAQTPGWATNASAGEMVFHATSRFRPPALILDLAIDKSIAYQQTFHSTGWERYSSGPGFLLTAGGTTTDPAQGFRGWLGTIKSGIPSLFIKSSDHGAGVPSTLIVSSARVGAGAHVPELIRFEGRLKQWGSELQDDGTVEEPESFEDNFCVYLYFACGVNFVVPDEIARISATADPSAKPCLLPARDLDPLAENLFTIDPAACPAWSPTQAAFWVLIFRKPCQGSTDDCGANGYWGFLELVPRSEAATREALVARVVSKNKGELAVLNGDDGNDELTYNSITSGSLTFKATGAYLTAIGGQAQKGGNEPEWPRSVGPIQRTFANDYRYTITNVKTGKSMVIDFGNGSSPVVGP